jgi:2-methylisocitrate lyase-like PEP mutase family enzyme
MGMARTTLRQLIAAGDLIVAPGVFEMFSAKLADRLGFEALYMTGYGISVSHLGLPDAGLATFTDMLSRARIIAEGTTTPLIADADTGYGGLLNVRHTVRGYEAAGVQAIQIEDQETPKKCGHTHNRQVIRSADMVRKIEVAVEARLSDDTLIIARTDARAALGLDEAIKRAQAYRRAGADVIFVEAPESEAEFERIGREVDAPLLANMVPTGKSPMLSAEKLRSLGFRIAIYPAAGMAAACAAMDRAYRHLLQHGSLIGATHETFDMMQLHELSGFPEVWAFERRNAQKE